MSTKNRGGTNPVMLSTVVAPGGRAFGSSSGVQTPDRSGFPSGAFGAGAARFGLPSRVRGNDVSGTFAHCAKVGAAKRNSTAAAAAMNFMTISLRSYGE